MGVGQANNEPAVLATFKLQLQDPKSIELDRGALGRWYSGAHKTVRKMFQGIASDELKELMGPRKEIGG